MLPVKLCECTSISDVHLHDFPAFERNVVPGLWLPFKQGFCSGNVRPTLLWIVARQRQVDDLTWPKPRRLSPLVWNMSEHWKQNAKPKQASRHRYVRLLSYMRILAKIFQLISYHQKRIESSNIGNQEIKSSSWNFIEIRSARVTFGARQLNDHLCQLLLKQWTDSKHETNAGEKHPKQRVFESNRTIKQGFQRPWVTEQRPQCCYLQQAPMTPHPIIYYSLISACFWVCLHGLHSELVRVTNVHRPNCRFLMQIPKQDHGFARRARNLTSKQSLGLLLGSLSESDHRQCLQRSQKIWFGYHPRRRWCPHPSFQIQQLGDMQQANEQRSGATCTRMIYCVHHTQWHRIKWLNVSHRSFAARPAVLSIQSLQDEVAYHTAVIRVHASGLRRYNSPSQEWVRPWFSNRKHENFRHLLL